MEVVVGEQPFGTLSRVRRQFCQDWLDEEGRPDLSRMLSAQDDYAGFVRLIILVSGYNQIWNMVSAQTSSNWFPSELDPTLSRSAFGIIEEVDQSWVAVGQICRESNIILLELELNLKLKGVVRRAVFFREAGLVIREIAACPRPAAAGLSGFSEREHDWSHAFAKEGVSLFLG